MYQAVSEIVSPDIVDLVTQYAILNELHNYNPEGEQQQVPNAHSVYADLLMESLLIQLKPSIEFVSGKTLIPTYSYYRVYRPGHDLKPHVDRESCEISVTVSFGRDYKEQNGKYDWPMFIEGTPVGLNPGDGIVYKGCDAKHWRETFNAPEFSYHVQGFFHYVDANGPYKEFALDKRQLLGQPKSKPKQNLPKKSYIIQT